jgi:Flp pilus assembly protein TadG
LKVLYAFRRQQGRLEAWLRREDGASAVEFALCAPVFMFACIMMADIGFAIHERMSLDHALRAAAQTAMYDPGEEEVEDVLETTASKHFTVTSGDEETDIASNAVTVDAARYCTCPDARSVSVACSTVCTGPVPTFTFYGMSVGKSYDGMILPPISFSARLDVQVR